MKNVNPLFLTDWYKPSHKDQYSPLSEVIFSNFTPRNASYFPNFLDEDERILNWGIQGFIKQYLIEYWNDNFFNLPLEKVISDYVEIKSIALNEEKVETAHIEKLHKYGKLPLEIRALPEGTLSPIKVPVYTVHNLRPDVMGNDYFYWLVNHLETLFSAETWKKYCNATTAFQYRKLLEQYAKDTCDDNSHIMFQAHDFSLRGFTGMEDGYSNGPAHLASFSGTDNIPSIIYVNNYYGMKGKFSGGSIPASEHSVATTNIGFIVGRLRSENPEMSQDDLRFFAEVEFIERYITNIYPKGIVSYVADSYDYQRIVRQAMTLLRDKILAREGKLVLRPDSGDPVKVVTGYKWDKNIYSSWHMVDVQEQVEDYEVVNFKGDYYLVEDYGISSETVTEDEVKGSVEVLWEIFGGTINSKGYKVLDPHIGLIYGDSITLKRAKEIVENLKDKGFASSNIVFGIGSYTYQYNTRDSLGFAFKATGSIIDGKEILVSKEPKTDLLKRSAFGFLKVVKDDNGIHRIVDGISLSEVYDEDNELRVVFQDGELIVDESLDTIRDRVTANITLD